MLPAIVVARKGSPHSGAQCEFVRVYEDREDGRTRLPAPEYTSVLDALRSQVRGAVLSPQGRYTIERGTLADPGVSDAPWQLATPENRDWLEIIEANQSGCFADVAKIRVGIKSTADRVFIRDDWGMLPVEQRPEADLLRPLITHHIANRWAARPTTKQVLYPHAVEGGKRVAINLASFPHARTYFEAHRVILESRKYVIESGRRWYEIWVPQAPEDWSSPKVVFPDISEEPRFLLDESGAVVNGDCYWATLKRGQDPRFLALMLAVANSSLIKKYYDIVFHNKLYAGRRRFMAQYVSKFPLPRLDSPSVARLLEIVGRLTKGSETVAVVEDLELELNALVWQSFGIIEEVSG